MSNSPSPSLWSSPNLPVRLSGPIAHENNADASFPSLEPAAITSTAPVWQNGAKAPFPSAAAAARQDHDGHLDGSFHLDNSSSSSNANTPRVSPARNGKHDPDKISLEQSSALSPPYPISNSTSFIPSSISDNHVFREYTTSGRKSHAHHIKNQGVITHRRSGSDNEIAVTAADLKANKYSMTSVGAPWLTASPSQNHHHFAQLPILNGIENLHNRSMEPVEEFRASRATGPANLTAERQEIFSEDRNRSSSRSSTGRVEKQIEATLADAGPTSNARSRKMSHVMGLFKENTSVPAIKRSNTASSASSDAATQDVPEKSQAVSAESKSEQANQYQGGQVKDLMRSSETESIEKSDVACQEQVQDPGPPRSDSQIVQITSDCTDTHNVEETTEKGSLASHIEGRIKSEDDLSSIKQRLPSNLLEEIRGYHNLAAPIHDKFRSGQSRPAVATSSACEKEAPGKENDPHASSKSTSQQPTTGKSPTSSADEEYDSEKEQISSALYYPHQAPSPEALHDVSIDDARKAKDAQESLTKRLPEPAIPLGSNVEEDSDDVEIALQSHNQSRYLHGDLQKARRASGDPDLSNLGEAGISSASESEYESLDENGQPSVRDDSGLSDDPEATPKASPTTKKSFLRSRTHKTRRTPAASVGAVELKPYNHQVGGHTKVFRFSKRAVCKQLSNRENVFYEVVEHQHPELLKFMPRYAKSFD